jgi:hypothetical protein
MSSERRIIGWRVKASLNGWIFFSDRERAESFANERNAMLEECYSDGSVQTLRTEQIFPVAMT